MKFLIITLITLSCSLLYSQQNNCMDFNQPSTTTNQSAGNCTGIYTDNVLDNWGAINIDHLSYRNANSQNGVNDYYLNLDDGGCGNGATFAYNNSDFTGNWLSQVNQENGCFCLDIRVFSVVSGNLNTFNFIRIHNGTNLGNSTLSAYFQLAVPLDVSQGWVRICAPVSSLINGQLPSNGDGQWVMSQGTNSDWNTLISNVNSFSFSVDVAGGDERFGVDNICLSNTCNSTLNPVNNDGAFCCDGDNLVENGNFENGNNGFTSTYSYQSVVAPNSVAPGQYGIVDDTQALTISPNWMVVDHTRCVSSIPNTDFMVVNGRTQQPSGTASVIYENTININAEKEHKLCLNLKNMPQCTFDIIPRVRIELSNAYFTDGYDGSWFAVNTTADLCDWLNINACFRAEGDTQSVTIRIFLAEDGNGDGNDLALDDISIQEKLEQDTTITVEHVGATNQITASVYDLTNTDDVLLTTEVCHLKENYYWFVYEVSSYPLVGPLANITTGTFAWSSNVSGWNDQTATAVSPVWGLTTMFPGYTFDNNKLYAIGMYIPSCCGSCYADKWTYQLTFNNRGNGGFVLTQAMKEEIKALFVMGNGVTNGEPTLEDTSKFKIYPNPSSAIFNLDFKTPITGQVNVTDINGRTLFTQEISEQNSFELNLENQSSGMYFVKVKSATEEFSEKIIKN